MNNYLVLILSTVFLIGCGDTGRDTSVPAHKAAGGGAQSGASGKVQQEALKSGVLLSLRPRSLSLSEITPSEITLGLRFVLNQRNDIGFRRFNFSIRNKEELTLDNSQFDLTPESRLKIELYRFKPTGKAAKEILAVQFQFENRDRSEADRSESSLVMLIELTKSNNAPIKTSFFYPTPENFNLKKWADDSVKDSKPQ